MAVAPFINIFRTKEEAFYFKNSQINTQFIFKGVQLLPNNPSKYIQKTNTLGGIDLEDYTVFVVDFETNEKTEITTSFTIESLTNSDDGSPQFYWSLLDIVYDFGYRLVYLEINQDFGETFYTNPFLITEIEEEKTSQFHYKEKKEDVYQSIGLQAWFYDLDKKTELTTYYEVSTKNTVSKAVKTSDIEIFKTELISKNTLILMTYLLESPILYVNNTRYSLFEAIEIPEKTSQENFSELVVNLSPNYNETFFGLADYNGVDYGTLDYNI